MLGSPLPRIDRCTSAFVRVGVTAHTAIEVDPVFVTDETAAVDTTLHDLIPTGLSGSTNDAETILDFSGRFGFGVDQWHYLPFTVAAGVRRIVVSTSHEKFSIFGHIAAVGGSDSHGRHQRVGHPQTVVFAANLSTSALVDGIRRARCYWPNRTR